MPRARTEGAALLNEGQEQLAGRLRALEERVARLEAGLASRAEPARQPLPPRAAGAGKGDPKDATAPPAGAPLATPGLAQGLLALLGRSLVALGGGYLLRAAADVGALPAPLAALAGLAYAAAWLLLCDREARVSEKRLSAAFHGLAALAIAFPLAVENTLRFRTFDAGTGILVVSLSTAAGLHVGRRRGLSVVRWAGALLGPAAGLVLAVAARDPLPVAAGLLALAILVEWRTFAGGEGERWPVALAADLAVLVTALLAARPGGPPEGYGALPPAAAAAASLTLSAAYVASAALRTLVAARALGAFELLQVPLALGIGLAGASRVLGAAGFATAPLGLVELLLGLACYWAAFAFVDRRAGERRTFYAYATLGLALVPFGLARLLPEAPLAVACGLLGWATAWIGERFDRVTLRSHSAVYAAVAAAAGGLLGAALDALAAAAPGPWRPAGWGAAAVLALLVGAYALLARSAASAHAAALAPRGALAALLAVAVSGLAVAVMAAPVAGAPGPAADAAALSALRMIVLAGLAVTLARAAARWQLRELAGLVPVVLAAGALKLLAEDFRLGRPLTLFLALAAYGASLIATSRLLGRRP